MSTIERIISIVGDILPAGSVVNHCDSEVTDFIAGIGVVRALRHWELYIPQTECFYNNVMCWCCDKIKYCNTNVVMQLQSACSYQMEEYHQWQKWISPVEQKSHLDTNYNKFFHIPLFTACSWLVIHECWPTVELFCQWSVHRTSSTL